MQKKKKKIWETLETKIIFFRKKNAGEKYGISIQNRFQYYFWLKSNNILSIPNPES